RNEYGEGAAGELDGERAAAAAFGEAVERHAQAGETVAGEERHDAVGEIGAPVVGQPAAVLVVEREHVAGGRGRVVGGDEGEAGAGIQAEPRSEGLEEGGGVLEGVASGFVVGLEPGGIFPEG